MLLLVSLLLWRAVIRGGRLLYFHQFQPHISSKFIFHQQNQVEGSLLQPLTEYEQFPVFSVGGGGGRGAIWGLAFIGTFGHQGGRLFEVGYLLE